MPVPTDVPSPTTPCEDEGLFGSNGLEVCPKGPRTQIRGQYDNFDCISALNKTPFFGVLGPLGLELRFTVKGPGLQTQDLGFRKL